MRRNAKIMKWAKNINKNKKNTQKTEQNERSITLNPKPKQE